jgi:transcriptional regulator with XRE-family HTH domain
LLAEERRRTGVTQVALAQSLNCPQSVISKVERGERRLDFVEFVAWADALRLDVAAFAETYRARLGPTAVTKARKAKRA